jgi:hypothetical protein
MPTISAEGGCICGAIRYRVTGERTGSMVCHCQTCRRVAGAPVVAWVTFPSAQFQVIRGQPPSFIPPRRSVERSAWPAEPLSRMSMRTVPVSSISLPAASTILICFHRRITRG